MSCGYLHSQLTTFLEDQNYFDDMIFAKGISVTNTGIEFIETIFDEKVEI